MGRGKEQEEGKTRALHPVRAKSCANPSRFMTEWQLVAESRVAYLNLAVAGETVALSRKAGARS
jgi:hypothetical protein